MFTPAPDLLLKVTPPRVPRHLLTREPLQIGGDRLRDAPTLLVQASPGYGKTSLLAQWRLELLGRGGVVAWLSCQGHDDPHRLLEGLTLAVRVGASRPGFGKTWLDGGQHVEALEGVTRWLAELAHSALEQVLILDEADRLPASSRTLLAYLLRNQPPNLRVIVAARSDCDLDLDDLLAYGQAIRLGSAELRFTLAETLDLVRQRLGPLFDADMAARLHELCEGWPLGLQLLLTALASGADAREALSALDAAGAPGQLRQQLLELLFARLDSEDVGFLEDISIADHLHPQLCVALSGRADAPERLARLARDTPLMSQAEQGDWLRLHTLARDRLRQRVAARPAAEQTALQQRATDWLEQQGRLEDAARHAWNAGQRERALTLAEKSLYDALTRLGHQSAVLEWLDRLSNEELARHPRLQLAAAWSLATSEHHGAAGRLVEAILTAPRIDEALRCECALILSGAAVFADDPDRFAALHDPWSGATSPLRDPVLLQMTANRAAFRQLIAGEPALARLRLQQGGPQVAHYLTHWSDLILGMSFLWEGQARQAEAQLQPALRRAESLLGRRSVFACQMAALLAATTWELGHPVEATALLANRLDILERSGMPEAVLLAYRTLARIASAAGAEPRALELLAGMYAAGLARRMPRLQLASLTEQVRLHARRFRSETCRALIEQIDAVLAQPGLPTGPIWRQGVDMLVELARGQAAIAARDWRSAIQYLQKAADKAQQRKLGRFHLEACGLRAFALDRCGEHAGATLMRETIDLADSFGLQRVFADAHPELGDWVRQLQAAQQGGASGPAFSVPAAPMQTTPAADPTRNRPAASMALTPKEREVLDLLNRNLSNKEIALAMQIGEQTIKWHVKNLFTKLDAGTRKQVVGRARILGLLPPLD